MDKKYYWYSYYCENSMGSLGSRVKMLENVTKIHPFVKISKLNDDYPPDKKEYTLINYREITSEEYDLFISQK